MPCMPPTPRPRAMEPEELRRLIHAAGYKDVKLARVAETIGVSRGHLYRWLRGATNINEATALLIRSKLVPVVPKKKRK